MTEKSLPIPSRYSEDDSLEESLEDESDDFAPESQSDEEYGLAQDEQTLQDEDHGLKDLVNGQTDDWDDDALGYDDHVYYANDDDDYKSIIDRSVASTQFTQFTQLKRETRAVLCLRAIVILMLFLAAVVVSALTHHFTRVDQLDDFRMQYDDHALRVKEAFQQSMETKMWTAYTLSAVFTGATGRGDHLRPWPNVSLPDFEEQSIGVLRLARAQSVMFGPVLRTAEDRAAWEAYAASNSKVNAITGEGGNHSASNRIISDGLFRVNEDSGLIEDENGPGPYLPLWQINPSSFHDGNGVMFNQRSNKIHRVAIDTMMRDGSPAWTDLLHTAEYSTPGSVLFYPIFENFANGRLVGSVSMIFIWEQIFANLLPEHSRGITVVLETSSGQRVTYAINGAEVHYVGAGDLHDRQFDHMEVSGKYVSDDDTELADTAGSVDSMVEDTNNEEDPTVTTDHENDRRSLSGRRRKLLNLHLRRRVARLFQDGTIDQQQGERNDVGQRDSQKNGGVGHEPVTYKIRVYPSATFQERYITNLPAIYTTVVVLIFFFTSAVFVVYDCLVERRQNVVMQRAKRSSEIVHSLFPAVVRERLFRSNEESKHGSMLNGGNAKNFFPRKPGIISSLVDTPTIRLKTFLNEGDDGGSDAGGNREGTEGYGLSASMTTEPIAEMFSDTTVMFADIAGFTAWSSEREPSQVFKLLEAMYAEFDLMAKKMGVFKVETIGDCYVAVTGLPDPNKDHALMMVRYALRCLMRTTELLRELEPALGPGTADLGLRFGLHSGPVTAGVLRGMKSRFQLFGDTMNTAARMESNGQKNMIHVSRQTADLIIGAGKGHMLVPRDELVTAKGKGEMQTYWVKKGRRFSTVSSVTTVSDSPLEHILRVRGASNKRDLKVSTATASLASDGVKSNGDQMQRSWHGKKKFKPSFRNVLKTDDKHSLQRSLTSRSLHPWSDIGRDGVSHGAFSSTTSRERLIQWNATVLESFLVKIKSRKTRRLSVSSALSSRSANTRNNCEGVNDIATVELQAISERARSELHLYVKKIASLYRDVHFHNFDHASHVLMSANKLIKRVCSRNDIGLKGTESENGAWRSRDAMLSVATFGISSDPLAQFAVVFAALIHDVEHKGVPNAQLVKERDELTNVYGEKGIAEQRSLDIAWNLLMEPSFQELRSFIFDGPDEKVRFRHLLIDIVMATDIADRERMIAGKKRWEDAFNLAPSDGEKDLIEGTEDVELSTSHFNVKATIVLEQIMLASDVAHTMQHWATFLKWNERLYKELRSAFLAKRGDKDPSNNWYENQISFFDNYIIPLGKKLKESGVFGTAGDEYLSYALENRRRWQEEGMEASLEIVKNCQLLPEEMPDPDGKHQEHDGEIDRANGKLGEGSSRESRGFDGREDTPVASDIEISNQNICVSAVEGIPTQVDD